MPELYPFQVETVKKLINNKRWLVNHEMGLGKSACAVQAANILGAQKVLVVCPAMVRLAWQKEFSTWWPDHPTAAIVDTGRARKLSKSQAHMRDEKFKAHIQIVSYSLLQHVDLTGWDVVVWDEIHRLQAPTSLSSKLARAIRDNNRDAYMWGLTATIMPDKPVNAWQPLDILWPGKWGKAHSQHKYISWHFANRYAIHELGYNGHHVFKGVNPLHKDELRARIAAVSSRTTKAEIAHLLPPFDVHVVQVDMPVADAIDDWIEDGREAATHMAILTKLRKTAEWYAAKYGGTYISGDLTPKRRWETIQQCMQQERGLLCATIDSVVEGIDLTKFTQVAVAELSYSPRAMVQVLGRFSRLSGSVPSSVQIIVQRGGISEYIATKLCQKLTAINSVVKPGATDNGLMQALQGESDEEFLVAVKKRVEEQKEMGNPYLDDFSLDDDFES